MTKLETMRRNLATAKHREFMKRHDAAMAEFDEQTRRYEAESARHEEFNTRISILTQMACADIFGLQTEFIQDQMTRLENEFGIKTHKPKLRAV